MSTITREVGKPLDWTELEARRETFEDGVEAAERIVMDVRSTLSVDRAPATFEDVGRLSVLADDVETAIFHLKRDLKTLRKYVRALSWAARDPEGYDPDEWDTRFAFQIEDGDDA